MANKGLLIRKRRTTVYINGKVWERFMKYLIEKHVKHTAESSLRKWKTPSNFL